MAYIDESLSAGEEVSALFRLHWVTRIPLAIWLLLGIPTLGITLVLALYEYLRVRNIEQGVTNKRVIYKAGIISRKSEEMKIGSIETVEIDQGIFGRILGYGNVKVTGRGTSDVLFRTVHDPMAVKRQIESISHPAA
ncbi:MAG: PH domain-containing protein [Betaproteobacteria bacterium]|nr:MAG: PH domain-containing protein [Betaproteobacteria bacterium]